MAMFIRRTDALRIWSLLSHCVLVDEDEEHGDDILYLDLFEQPEPVKRSQQYITQGEHRAGDHRTDGVDGPGVDAQLVVTTDGQEQQAGDRDWQVQSSVDDRQRRSEVCNVLRVSNAVLVDVRPQLFTPLRLREQHLNEQHSLGQIPDDPHLPVRLELLLLTGQRLVLPHVSEDALDPLGEQDAPDVACVEGGNVLLRPFLLFLDLVELLRWFFHGLHLLRLRGARWGHLQACTSE